MGDEEHEKENNLKCYLHIYSILFGVQQLLFGDQIVITHNKLPPKWTE